MQYKKDFFSLKPWRGNKIGMAGVVFSSVGGAIFKSNIIILFGLLLCFIGIIDHILVLQKKEYRSIILTPLNIWKWMNELSPLRGCRIGNLGIIISYIGAGFWYYDWISIGRIIFIFGFIIGIIGLINHYRSFFRNI